MSYLKHVAPGQSHITSYHTNAQYRVGGLEVFVNNSAKFAGRLQNALPDNDLLTRIRANDEKAFEQLFRLYYKGLCNHALTLLKDREASEETVQATFVRLWEKRGSLVIETSVKSYLYRAVHNTCLNELKHLVIKDTYKHYNAEHLNTAHASATDTTHAAELQNRITKAIDTLPEQCGIIFKMSRYEELTYKEIADTMGLSVKTVENQMGKALKLMRTQLADYLVMLTMVIMYLN